MSKYTYNKKHACELNDFADALRACLDLDPIPRPRHGRHIDQPTVSSRFYAQPQNWNDPTRHGQTLVQPSAR